MRYFIYSVSISSQNIKLSLASPFSLEKKRLILVVMNPTNIQVSKPIHNSKSLFTKEVFQSFYLTKHKCYQLTTFLIRFAFWGVFFALVTMVNGIHKMKITCLNYVVGKSSFFQLKESYGYPYGHV
jgi:hypothetical protein